MQVLIEDGSTMPLMMGSVTQVYKDPSLPRCV